MSENIRQVTQENFKKELEKGLFLVDFYADWCGPCRMLTPVLEKIAQEMAGKVTVVKLDIDHAQQTASSCDITSVPTLILFKDGKEVGRIVGLRDAESIKQFIRPFA